MAASAEELESNSRAALKKLYQESETAKTLGAEAKAVLVFPKIVKAGLLVGGQYGDGTLFQGGKVAGFYNSGAVSYGLQAGIQWFGYAMFLMDDAALKYLHDSDGWEIGSGPSVVVWDQGRRGIHVFDDAAERRGRLHFRPRGFDGGPWFTGDEDHRDLS